METNRLLAFSDGVLAVIITIMVLELKAPEGGSFYALLSAGPAFFGYLLSFVYVGIYWNNHHHLFQLVDHVDGKILWANLHLLFWLSLIPFATSWLNDRPEGIAPTVTYGLALLMPSVAYLLLQTLLTREHPRLRKAVGRDLKGRVSPFLYALGIGVAFIDARISEGIYVLVALAWLIPDPRIEREVE